MTVHAPLLHSTEEIARARKNVRESESARQIADQTLRLADRWAAFDDGRLRAFVPPPEVPRAFNSSFEGCPIHGRALFDHGNYSWIFDPFSAPWRLICPIGGEVYPSNDFGAFLASGLRDRSLLTGPYADDGWGWQPVGAAHKHWFIAYYCHWLWMNHLVPATLALARAYLLTGESAYAHKAGILLTQIARDYPRMDLNKQGRYALEFVPSYTGKIVNAIWECSVARDLAEAWDAVVETVARDPALGPPAVQLVETNLLREALRAIPERRILGNYGMHQQAAVYLALALGDPTEAAVTLRNVVEGWPGTEGYQYEGLATVLANLVSAEGMDYEIAPGYCAILSNLLPTMIDPLRRLERLAHPTTAVSLVARLPHLRELVEWPSRLVCLDQWTPAIGDSGTAAAPGIVDVSLPAYRAIYQQAPSPLLAARWRGLVAADGTSFSTFEDLFADRLVPAADTRTFTATISQQEPEAAQSDVLTDYGLAILRAGSGRNAVALTLHYGRANASHAHADRLNIELFGAGRKLIPDLGYPQFASEDKISLAWDRNTGSHATTVVDGRRQPSQSGGRLLTFACSTWLQVVAADSPAYPSLDRYERLLALVGDGRYSPAYAVDVFQVRGGTRHDYRLHGSDLPDSIEGVVFGPEQPGSLAGPDVPKGFLWDDPELEQPNKKRSFGTYQGCGDSFLYGVRLAQPGLDAWRMDWGDASEGLRVHVLTAHLSKAFLAWGDAPRRPANPTRVRYLILRREGEAPLDSIFLTILEPVVARRRIRHIERLCEAERSGQIALRVTHDQGSDLILLAERSAPLELDGMVLDGRLGVVRYDTSGRAVRAFLAGRRLQAPGVVLARPGRIRGTIVGTEAMGRVIIVDTDEVPGVKAVRPDDLCNTVLAVEGSRQRALIKHAAIMADGRLRLELDRAATVGRLVVESGSSDQVITRTTLYVPFGDRDDLGLHLEGTWLLLNGRARRVRSVTPRRPQGHTIVLDEPVGSANIPGSTAMLLAWHTGVPIELEPAGWWTG